jgi:hypothetical protein
MSRKVVFALVGWLAAITGLHLWLNFDWESYLNEYRPERERKLNVAYIPVT